jgi:hypothetical protein
VKIPWAETDRVYDVRYHTRDTRRSLEKVLHGDQTAVVEVTAANVGEQLDLASVQNFTPGSRHGSQDPGVVGSQYVLAEHLDQTNGGYT